MSMTRRFLAQLAENAEAYRAGERDFASYYEGQRATWRAVSEAGPAVEEAVMVALLSVIGARFSSASPNDEHATAQLRPANRVSGGDPAQRGLLVQVGHVIILHLEADRPGTDREYRQIAARVYELAADLERRSHVLSVHWTIMPDADDSSVIIELSGMHELELARELLTTVMRHHQLT